MLWKLQAPLYPDLDTLKGLRVELVPREEGSMSYATYAFQKTGSVSAMVALLINGTESSRVSLYEVVVPRPKGDMDWMMNLRGPV